MSLNEHKMLAKFLANHQVKVIEPSYGLITEDEVECYSKLYVG